MHFAFSEQQTEFRDAVRQVLGKECTTNHLRAAYEHPEARGARWATLTELGVVGLTVPEDRGGLGLGPVDLVLLLEEAGRVALPEPLLETTALAVPLLVELGESGRLDAIASGSLSAAVADPSRPSAPVAGADGADLLVLTSGTAEGGDLELHLVEASSVTVEPVGSLDPTRRLGLPRWTPGPDTRVLAGADAAAALAALSDRAAVATAAVLLGLTERMIDIAATYAKERQQFGRPIGSFQAVKHLLAGAQVRLEFARPVVYGAAWALDTASPDAARAASVAKAYASDAATEAARVSLQVHGAIGYTWECDLQLFLKRAWALSEAWGSAADHRARVLDGLVDGS
jgi:alkylation response protein AidB-like acyl-CoA dehydrogenase